MSSRTTGNAIVIIKVLDVNDNEPIFLSQPYHAFVPISAKKSHVLAKVNFVKCSKYFHFSIACKLRLLCYISIPVFGEVCTAQPRLLHG